MPREVSGLDLRVPLTKEQAAEVEAAMDKYAVLVFHGQDISDEQQLAFARCMRAHGVSDFPDPNGNGTIQINSVSGSDLDPQSSAFQTLSSTSRQARFAISVLRRARPTATSVKSGFGSPSRCACTF